jgi:hypothetical protein
MRDGQVYPSGMADAAPSPDPTTDKPPRRRRWIPLALRMFVVILVLLATASALWIGIPIYRQQVVIRKLEGVGGRVMAIPGNPQSLSAILPRW